MRMRTLLTSLILFGLAACATSTPLSASAPHLTRNTRAIVTYGCEGGTRLTVVYLVSPDSVEITHADGRKQTLPNAISASGARYAAGGAEFWSKGDEAMFTAAGKAQTNCTVAK
jgi:membrane-bound inhibitor of C-type lysozyme